MAVPEEFAPPIPLPLHSAPPTAPDVRSDPALALMVERVAAGDFRSGAEVLQVLRTAFPDVPLALRVAALGMAVKR